MIWSLLISLDRLQSNSLVGTKSQNSQSYVLMVLKQLQCNKESIYEELLCAYIGSWEGSEKFVVFHLETLASQKLSQNLDSFVIPKSSDKFVFTSSKSKSNTYYLKDYFHRLIYLKSTVSLSPKLGSDGSFIAAPFLSHSDTYRFPASWI